MNDDPELRQAVRRVVGLATLRRLRGMADAEAEQEAVESRRARWLAITLIVAAVLAVAWIAIR